MKSSMRSCLGLGFRHGLGVRLLPFARESCVGGGGERARESERERERERERPEASFEGVTAIRSGFSLGLALILVRVY
jgi:hypothetical protein